MRTWNQAACWKRDIQMSWLAFQELFWKDARIHRSVWFYCTVDASSSLTRVVHMLIPCTSTGIPSSRSEKARINLFIHIGVTAVRVGTWPFILRGVTLHERHWEFERFIGCCTGNKISLIYNAKYPELFTFFSVLKMITTNPPLVCPLCFLVIFAILGFLCHHCSSPYVGKMKIMVHDLSYKCL